jgi:hypothetical protein
MPFFLSGPSTAVLSPRKHPMMLSMSRHINISGISDILKIDQARVHLLSLKASEGGFSLAEINEPITNMAIHYAASVGIGSPPTECKVHNFVLRIGVLTIIRSDNLIVDTGR